MSRSTREIVALLKDSGLLEIPFSIEFLDDDKMAITTIRDEDDPHRHEMLPDDEANIKAIASIFANVSARHGLTFTPGYVLDVRDPRGH